MRVLINSISVNFNEKLIALPEQICQKGWPLKRILENRNKVEKTKAAKRKTLKSKHLKGNT